MGDRRIQWYSLSVEAFDHPEIPLTGAFSQTILEDLFFAACRGGWPRCLAISDREAKLEIAKDYYRQIYQKDASAIDGVKRNPEWVRTLLWSYARNMATLAKKTSIYADVKATQNVTDVTLSSYISVLENCLSFAILTPGHRRFVQKQRFVLQRSTFLLIRPSG